MSARTWGPGYHGLSKAVYLRWEARIRFSNSTSQIYTWVDGGFWQTQQPWAHLPGHSCQGHARAHPWLVTVFGHSRLLPCFLLSFPPLEEKKSESNHKVSHLLFRNIFLLLFPVISKYFSGIIPPHMKRQARCNILHVLTGSTFLGNSCLVD